MFKTCHKNIVIPTSKIMSPDELEECISKSYSNIVLGKNMIIVNVKLMNKEGLAPKCDAQAHSTSMSYTCRLMIQGFSVSPGYLYLCNVVQNQVINVGKNNSTVLLVPMTDANDSTNKTYDPYLYPEYGPEYVKERSYINGLKGLTSSNIHKRARIAMTMNALGESSENTSLISALKEGNIIVRVKNTTSSIGTTQMVVNMSPAGKRKPLSFVACENMPTLKPDMSIITDDLKKFFMHNEIPPVTDLIVGSTYCLGIQGYFEPTENTQCIHLPIDDERLIRYIKLIYTNWQEVAMYSSTRGLCSPYSKYLSR